VALAIASDRVFPAVPNGTAWLLSYVMMRMLNKRTESEVDTATSASVKNEMAKPRMARSAKVAALNLDRARIPEQPSASMSGTVDKIILRVRANRKGTDCC